ncbi:putative tetratricopeptide-like helical domain superfamily, DYW domain-containing protein [Helianthus annuus]|nr:putative tetratricopeptide-like helical domain superfamily, DYW domain-containing protein [Helianthus annuus]KAJ0541501.1 putative tetratricopeptide-like helical domain superfamily, DYW domain-containing protein [Helianthus annuus]KAJ0706576.1 putative tetratricopeptide-like helical domain superfamily, DYW domain-containing protein [Helianthus annuus]KAJ0887145.1 putative tetratricopeptide-like helical domain superfamily, DYW domain-containing protein [Helianthus annuus]
MFFTKPKPPISKTLISSLHHIKLSHAGNPHHTPSPLSLLKNPSISSINNLLRSFTNTHSPHKTLSFYSFIRKNYNFKPNNYTFTFLLQTCTKFHNIVAGFQVHGHVIKLGFYGDVFVGNSLVNLYFVFGEEKCARQVFDEMSRRDLVTWNVVIAGWVKLGRVGDARKVFDEMPERDAVSWSSLITGYVRNGLLEEGVELFERMVKVGVVPNEAGLVMVFSACAQLGLVENAIRIHSIVDALSCRMTVHVWTGLVDMYAKCGCIDKARELFEKMPEKDVSSWNVMICGLAMHGLGMEAIKLFEKFLIEGHTPVNVTFIGVLSACSKAGLVDEGYLYFKLMTEKYGIVPEMEHYGCMVDLLSRAGLVTDAIEFVEQMPIEPDPVLWVTILGACRTHGLVELGEKSGQKLIELDPTRHGNYVQLSSIYARSNKWEEVVRTRGLITGQNSKKVPGWSLIEAQGKIHRFVAGDRQHDLTLEIYMMLNKMNARIAEAGYSPNVSPVLHDVEEEEKVNAVKEHSERLAIAFGLLVTEAGECIRVVKNLRVCGDCHEMTKITSMVFEREIVVRDGCRFHHFRGGECSCGDYW